MDNRLNVGYWLHPTRAPKHGFDRFSEYCKTRGINLIQVELVEGIGVTCREEISLFLHRLNDLVVDVEEGDQSAALKLDLFNEWQRVNNNAFDVIDRLPMTLPLLSRWKMANIIDNVVASLHKPGLFFTPPFCLLKSNKESALSVKEARVTYPTICKPIAARNHNLTVVRNENELEQVKTPCLAQTLINHDEILLKTYVIGDRAFVLTWPSLPDRNRILNLKSTSSLQFKTSWLGKGPVEQFNADRTVIFEADENLNHSKQHFNKKEIEISNKLIEGLTELVSKFRQELCVDLFGLDIIKEAGSNRLACIDVNIFPPYRAVPNHHEELASYLIRRHRKCIDNGLCTVHIVK